MASGSSQAANFTERLPIQRVRVFFPDKEPSPAPIQAWLWISSCIRWRYVSAMDEKPPLSFSCFRRQWSLSLERRSLGCDWGTVEKFAQACDAVYGCTIIVSGFVCGPRHNKCLLKVGFVLEEESTRIAFMESLRIRISPWDLLYQRLDRQLLNTKRLYASSLNRESLQQDESFKFESVLKHSEVDGISSEKENIALSSSEGQHEMEDEEIQSITSLALSMLIFPALIADVTALVSHGRENCPAARHLQTRVAHLRENLVISLNHIIDDCTYVNESAVRDLFEVQEEILDEIMRIESRVMSKRFWQFWNRVPWREIESAIEYFQETVQSLERFCRVPPVLSCDGELLGYSGALEPLVTLAERDLETDSEDVDRALRECAVVNRRSGGSMTLRYSEILFKLGGVQNPISSGEAALLFQQCLEIRRSIFGLDVAHVEVASAIFAFAEVLRLNEYLDAAMILFCEGLAMYRQFLGRETDDSEFSNVLFKVATVLEDNGCYEEASTLLEECLKLKRKMQATLDDTLELAIILFVSGRVLDKMLYLARAEMCYRESLRIEYLVYGHVDQMDIAQTLYALGCVLDKMNKTEEAVLIFDECLSMRQRLHGVGVDSTYISHVLYALGSAHEKMSQLDEALTFYTSCLQMERRIYADGVSLDLASSLFACGRIMMRKESLEEARESFQNCLDMLLRVHGNEDDLEISRTMAALAGVLSHQNEYDEAEDLYRKCLSMNRRLMGDDHDNADIAWVLQKLAELLVRKHSHGEAELLFKESFAMKDRLYGEKWDRSVVWLSLYDLAISILQADEDDSERLFRESLEILSHVHGRSACQSSIAAIKLGLARSLFSKGNLKEAGKLFKESLLIFEKFYRQNDHISFAHALDWNGLYAAAEGSLEQAERFYTRSLEMHRRLKGEDSDDADIVHILAELGKVALERGMFEKSSNFHMESLAMAQSLGDESRTGNALFELATVAREANDVIKAEKLYRESLQALRRIHGQQDHGDVATTLIGLATVIQTKGPRAFVEAENLFRQGFGMKKRLNDNCIYTSVVLYDLALSALDFLLLDDAVRLFRESLKLDKLKDGENEENSNIANTLEGLAKALMEKGDLVQAERLFNASFEMSTRSNAKKDTGNELFWKARLAFEKGTLQEAERLFSESLEAFHCQFKNQDDPEVAITLHWQARVDLESRNLQSATTLFQQSTHMYRRMRSSSPDHTDLSFALYWESRAAFESGELEKAETLMVSSLEMDQRLHGHDIDHTDITSTLYRLAEVELAKNDLDAASQHSTEALVMARRLFGEDIDQLFVANALRMCGRVAMAKSMFDEAEKFFSQCLEMRLRMDGEFVLPGTAESVYWLAQLARKRGAIVHAVRELRRCLCMYRQAYSRNLKHPRIIELELELCVLEAGD